MSLLGAVLPAGMTLCAAAADRLFDEFAILAGIGVAIGIALWVIGAFRKVFGGLN